jgi:organic hydroperoxide reductase OsmC/OhrA
MNYTVKILWNKNTDEKFTDRKYSRRHQWILDGGMEILASSSPQVVPLPMSDAAAVDPEEAFLAALSSCHMLFFLSIAAAQNFIVEKYEDNAEGIMEKIESGEMAMTSVTLKPTIIFACISIPSEEQIANMHKTAHKKCYIANSVKSEIHIIPS